MTFPNDLDSLFDPEPTTPLNNAPKGHDDWHTDANNAIEALEAKVGVDSSADTDSLDYKVANIPSQATIVSAALAAVYPVGCIYTTIVSTNPASVFGFGTWSAFGAGKVLVSLDSTDADFDTAEDTGGSKTMAHTHTTADHTHTTTDHNHDIAHVHQTRTGDAVAPTEGLGRRYDLEATNSGGASAGNTTSGASTGNTTSAASNENNLQPYIVVYMFKRTA